eukprot:2232993-Amphidinium_carterae.1
MRMVAGTCIILEGRYGYEGAYNLSITCENITADPEVVGTCKSVPRLVCINFVVQVTSDMLIDQARHRLLSAQATIFIDSRLADRT